MHMETEQITGLLLAPGCDVGCQLGRQTDVSLNEKAMCVAAAMGFRRRATCKVQMLQRPDVVGYACSLLTPVSILLPTDIEHTVSIYPTYHEKKLPFIEGCA